MAYPATVFCEAFPAIGCGRSGPLAFRILSAPWLDARALAEKANPALSRTGFALAPYAPPPFSQVIATAMAQAGDMAAWKGERSALLEMRKHFAWYTFGRRNAAQVRTKINLASSFEEVEALLRALEQEQE